MSAQQYTDFYLELTLDMAERAAWAALGQGQATGNGNDGVASRVEDARQV